MNSSVINVVMVDYCGNPALKEVVADYCELINLAGYTVAIMAIIVNGHLAYLD